MPSAVPLTPGWPSLPMQTALGLFRRAGCPACWRASEASEAYLASYTQESYPEADVWHQLVAARGLCAAHTRRLAAQLTVSGSLAAGYADVIRAAMSDVAAQPASCPVCKITAAATDDLLRYLLAEATRGDRRTYKQHGGLCLPHLRAAAAARGDVDIRWLVRFMIVRLTSGPALDLLAGGVDSGGRATACGVMSRGRPGASAGSCEVCQAAARTERAHCDAAPDGYLCGQHLRDMTNSSRGAPADVLAAQAALHAARLAQVVDGRARRLGTYLPVRARRALADPGCVVCRARTATIERQVARVADDLLRPDRSSSDLRVLCVRHVRAVHAVDAQAGRAAEAHLHVRGQQLLDELSDAGSSAAAGECTGWRRAADFLDGSAFALSPVV